MNGPGEGGQAVATDDDGGSAPDAPGPQGPREAPDHRSDAAYVLVLAITDRQVTYNAMLLLGALGAVVCGISATWLLLGSQSPWGVLLTGGGATVMVTAGTARWVARRMVAKQARAATAATGATTATGATAATVATAADPERPAGG